MNIFTIGHSTHDQEKLINMLHENNIQTLVDIRSYPGSRRYPHFNKENMSVWLTESNINYIHMPLLGGRRRKLKDIESHNDAWENVSFKNYADYTTTNEFEIGLNDLIQLAKNERVAYMCSEHHPSRCHRTIVSDNLTAIGVNVFHIQPYGNGTKLQKHVLGGWGARPIVENGKVIYPSDQLCLQI